jgi:hypothetical protein
VSEKVSVDLVLTLLGEAASPDGLRALRAWLLEEDELRGCIQTRECPPGPDRLGPVLDALHIVGNPAAAVLTASLVAWLKTRVGNVRLVLTLGSGGKVELEAKNVRRLDADALTELTERLTRFVSDDSDGYGLAEKTDLNKGVRAPIQGSVERSGR